MANAEQIQTMLETMQRQMEQMERLHSENARLRDEAGNGTPQDTSTRVRTVGQTKKPDRPVVNAGINDREWALFMDTWARYQRMANINDADTLRMELRASCSDDVNKMLFEFVGPATLDRCNEQQLLGHIKSVAVKSVHKEVHRRTFNMMSQNDGERIPSWVARLRSQAVLCEFKKNCSCNPSTVMSYADEMVAQRLVAGLSNQEHQRRILQEASTLVTLDQKIERLRVFETTEESSSVLHTASTKPSEAAGGKSLYQRQKTGESNKDNVGCIWCGLVKHPRGKSMDRANCPAREQKCNKCDQKGHYGRVCENSSAEAAPTSTESADDIAANASVSFGFAAEDFRHSPGATGRP